MRNLLGDMRENTALLSREMHRSLYPADTLPLADPTFDGIAGRGRPVVSKRRIEDEIRKLNKVSAIHKKFINKRIAHFDRVEKLQSLPTISDLDRGVRKLEGLVRDYTLLLEARSILTLRPIPQYDWNALFEKPWITSEQSDG